MDTLDQRIAQAGAAHNGLTRDLEALDAEQRELNQRREGLQALLADTDERLDELLIESEALA